jgi:hypothetical protein
LHGFNKKPNVSFFNSLKIDQKAYNRYLLLNHGTACPKMVLGILGGKEIPALVVVATVCGALVK